jgi:hypothetical protein
MRERNGDWDPHEGGPGRDAGCDGDAAPAGAALIGVDTGPPGAGDLAVAAVRAALS